MDKLAVNHIQGKTGSVRRTSDAGPTFFTNGKVTRLGTKNTGSHFASNAAPGLRILKSLSPIGSVKRVINKAPHPPSDDGKEMASFLNSRRNPTSSASKRSADTRVGVANEVSTAPLTLLSLDPSFSANLWILGDLSFREFAIA